MSVAGTTGRGGRNRSRCGGRRADRDYAGSCHEEVLDALAGDLVGLVVGEGVQQVTVVGDLVAVGVLDHRDLAAHSGGGGARRGQRWPQLSQLSGHS